MNDIKRKVKEKIKEYSNEDYLAGYIRNEYLLDDGIAKIMMRYENKNEIFDSRTFGNQLNLNQAIYDYIDNKTSMLDNDISIKLYIVCPNLEKSEEERIKHVISEHYAIELYETQKEYKRYNNKTFKLILTGILFLLFYVFIATSFSSLFLIEVLVFLFSFTLWQAFETLIYTINDIKIRREAITQKLIMDIKYIDDEDNFDK